MLGLLIGIVVVLLIVIIALAWANRNKHKRRHKVVDLAQISAGIMDWAAKAALAEEAETSEAKFTQGQILRYNLINNEPANAPRDVVVQVHRNYAAAAQGIVLGNTDDLPDGILAAMFGEEVLPFTQDFILQQIDDWNGLVAGGMAPVQTQAARIATRENKKTKAKELAKSRAEATDLALGASAIVTDDRQNVHDSMAQNDLRKILGRLRSDNDTNRQVCSPEQATAEAREYLRMLSQNPGASGWSAEKIARAQKTLDTISEKAHISTYNDTEDSIFASVWARADHAGNSDRKDAVREAVLTALADSVENNTQVCINGRVGRVLNSLAVVDYDPAMTGAMTTDAYRAQIFKEAQDIFDGAISRAPPTVERSLRDPSAPAADPKEEQAFFAGVKKEIDAKLLEYDKLPKPELEKIRADCHAFVDMS